MILYSSDIVLALDPSINFINIMTFMKFTNRFLAFSSSLRLHHSTSHNFISPMFSGHSSVLASSCTITSRTYQFRSLVSTQAVSADIVPNVFGYKPKLLVQSNNCSVSVPSSGSTIIQGFIDTYVSHMTTSVSRPSGERAVFKGSGTISFDVVVSFCLMVHTMYSNNAGLFRSARIGRMFDFELILVIMAYQYIYVCAMDVQIAASTTSNYSFSKAGHNNVHMPKYFIDLIRNALVGSVIIPIDPGSTSSRFGFQSYVYEGSYQLPKWAQPSDQASHVSNILAILLGIKPEMQSFALELQRGIGAILSGDLITNQFGDIRSADRDLFNSHLELFRGLNMLASGKVYSNSINRATCLEFRKAYIGGDYLYKFLGYSPIYVADDFDFGPRNLDLMKLFPVGKARAIPNLQSPLDVSYSLDKLQNVPGAADVLVNYVGNSILLETDVALDTDWGVGLLGSLTVLNVQEAANFSAHYTFIVKWVFDISIDLVTISARPSPTLPATSELPVCSEPNNSLTLAIEDSGHLDFLPSSVLAQPVAPSSSSSSSSSRFFGKTGGSRFSDGPSSKGPKPLDDGSNPNRAYSGSPTQSTAVTTVTDGPGNTKRIDGSIKDSDNSASTLRSLATSQDSSSTPQTSGPSADSGSSTPVAPQPALGKRAFGKRHTRSTLTGSSSNISFRSSNNVTRRALIDLTDYEKDELRDLNLPPAYTKNNVFDRILEDLEQQKLSEEKKIEALCKRFNLTRTECLETRINERSTLLKKLRRIHFRSDTGYNLNLQIECKHTFVLYHLTKSFYCEDRLLLFIENLIHISIRFPPIPQTCDGRHIKEYLRRMKYPKYEVQVQINKSYSKEREIAIKSLNLDNLCKNLDHYSDYKKVTVTKRMPEKHLLTCRVGNLVTIATRYLRRFNCIPARYVSKIRPIKVVKLDLNSIIEMVSQWKKTFETYTLIRASDLVGVIHYERYNTHITSENGLRVSYSLTIYVGDVHTTKEDSDVIITDVQ